MAYKIIIVARPGLSDSITDGIAAKLAKMFKSVEVLTSKNGAENVFELPFDSSKDYVLFVSLGGDGTMLGAIRSAAQVTHSYVIGFNVGHLGFLVHPITNTKEITESLKIVVDNWLASNDGNINVLSSGTVRKPSLKRSIKIDTRRVLRYDMSGFCSIMGGEIDPARGNSHMGVAANEVMITPNSIAGMLEYNVVIDGTVALELQRSSGVVVSTPTGSTGMNLSIGGAIVHPQTEVMQIAHIAPHTFNSRSIIIPGSSTVIIEPAGRSIEECIDKGFPVFADGRQVGQTRLYETMAIQLHTHDVRIIRPAEWSFFETLNEKFSK